MFLFVFCLWVYSSILQLIYRLLHYHILLLYIPFFYILCGCTIKHVATEHKWCSYIEILLSSWMLCWGMGKTLAILEIAFTSLSTPSHFRPKVMGPSENRRILMKQWTGINLLLFRYRDLKLTHLSKCPIGDWNLVSLVLPVCLA